MANTIDVAPAAGHPVMATELGIGLSPGYDAIDLRRMSMVGQQEGVHDSGGWNVTQHTPAAMQVDIAGTVGLATVQGDTITAQGFYVVAPHSATASLDIATAHATLPRIDQVLLHVYDNQVDGLGSNRAAMEILTGTATSGATLDNRNGAASLPATAIRLADVLVPGGAGTIVNSNIRDRRRWANGAVFFNILTSGDVSTSSNTFQNVGGSALQFRVEISPNTALEILFTAQADPGSSSTALNTTLLVDGSGIDSGAFYGNVPGTSANFVPAGFAITTVNGIASGSRLLAPGYRSGTGGTSVTLHANVNRPASFFFREHPLPGAGANGLING